MMYAFEQIDLVRRLQGHFLDMIGLSPVETPARIVFSIPPFTLKAYGDPKKESPALLIVPAPIKASYIWDIHPAASVVQQCLRKGLRVYLLQWKEPTQEQNQGLAVYADQYILACLDAITNETGQRSTFLAGHSLGGTFVAIFAAIHPERVRGLILLGAPLQFGTDAGAFAPLVAIAPRAQVIAALSDKVSGSFLNMVSVLASPSSFLGERWLDWLRSLPDFPALRTHLLVVRWTMDEMPLSKQLFEEVVELLYREDRFMRGRLIVDGHLATPAAIHSPIISVVELRSRVVPSRSVLPFHAAVGSADTQVLWYEREAGVALQHVGMLVGKRAQQGLWPEILFWLSAH